MATAAAEQAQEMRTMGSEELSTRLQEAREELFNLRFQVATGQLDNNARLRTVRRSIARIYTVMRERELGISYVEEPTGDRATGAAGSGTGEGIEATA
jgi:large subunit ribosomal protein L29